MVTKSAMSRIYLLVQNNIRTGPFTLEELLQQPSHDNGLVWIIGQSEDWLSPLEIASLESYYYKRPDGSIAVKETVLEDIRSRRFVGPYDTGSVEEHRLGVLDTQLLQESPDIIPASVTEKKEAHNQVIENKDYTQYRQVTAQEERMQTKAALNEKEDDNLTIARKNWAVVGIAALLIVFVAWNALFKDGVKEKRTLANNEKKEQLIENTSFNAAAMNETTENAPVAGEPSRNEVYNSAGPVTSTDSFLDSVQQVMNEQDQLMADVDAVYHKSFLYKKRYPSKQTAVSNNRRSKKTSSYPIATIKKTNTAAKVPLIQQVDLQSRLIMDKNRQQVNAIELKVKNNSQELLKKVSVDVYYYKNGQKLLNKETVYFTNIYPDQLMTMSIASNQRATSARSQLGMVSAGKN